jgi:osmotically-inducible protein OsmY
MIKQMTLARITLFTYAIILSFAMQSCGVAPRTLGTYIEDHSIASQAKKIIKDSDYTESNFSVQAHAFNEVLLLTGEIAREKNRIDLFDRIADIPKVRQIHNEISIGNPITNRTKLSDRFIKSKIKSKILFKNIAKRREVKIICRNGTVYLMGLINDTKAAKLTTIVRETRGVNSVVTLLETTK